MNKSIDDLMFLLEILSPTKAKEVQERMENGEQISADDIYDYTKKVKWNISKSKREDYRLLNDIEYSHQTMNGRCQ